MNLAAVNCGIRGVVKLMKKIFGLILSAAVLGTVLTACGGSGAGVSFSGAAGASERCV